MKSPISPSLSIGGLACLLLCSAAACQGGASPDRVARPATPGNPAPPVDVSFRVTVPADTPADAAVHVAGDFQGWDPGSAAHALTRLDDGLYTITLAFEPGTRIELKFTLGSWKQVERAADNTDVPNRALTIPASGPAAGPAPHTFDFTVARWADGTPPPSTITGKVTTITVPGFLDGRRVWVYLPPGYEDAPNARYPVLYMLDGQNVFDQATSFAGEWQVDETCESLIAASAMRPIVVVAVDNAGSERLNEYAPWPDAEARAGGRGDQHLQAITSVLVPYIDAHYRTLPAPGGRALAGSSLGGLMTLYATYAHADTFGLGAALSPSLGWDEQHLTRFVRASRKPARSRIYMDMGTRERGNLWDPNGNGIDDNIEYLRTMRDVLVAQGFVPGSDLMVVEDPGARHHETYWAARFPEALTFLFPP